MGAKWSDGTTEFTTNIAGVPALNTAGYGVKIYNPMYNKFIGYREVGYTDKVGIALVDFDDAVVFTVTVGQQAACTLNFQVKNNPRLAGFTLDSSGLQNGYTEWWTSNSSSAINATIAGTWFVGGKAAPNYMWQYAQDTTYHSGSSAVPAGSAKYITLNTTKVTSTSA